MLKRALWMGLMVAIAGCKESQPPAGETSAPVSPAPTMAASGAPSATNATVPQSPGTPTAIPSVTQLAAPPAGDLAGLWNFDSDKSDVPPSGFSFGRTGQGKEGRWLVVVASEAPSKPNVLAQLDADPTDYRFPLAVVDGSAFKNVKLSVSCKPISGRGDQGCGLVWRYKDANNYYLTRANALEDNVRLYYVKDGRRVQFSSWSGKVASGQWHRLRVEAKGDRFEVDFDDKKVLDAKDSTFADAGKVGVWTKADSVIQFDDLTASSL